MEIGLIITSELTTSQGMNVSNSYLTAVFYTNSALTTGTVNCDLFFYKSKSDKDNGVSNFYPVNSDVMITNDSFIVLPTDVIKQSGKTTFADVAVFFYAKLKDSLQTKYGWTII